MKNIKRTVLNALKRIGSFIAKYGGLIAILYNFLIDTLYVETEGGLLVKLIRKLPVLIIGLIAFLFKKCQKSEN